jgi:hypothetical protein
MFVRALACVMLAYSAWHFTYSVRDALSRPNLKDIGREMVPLQQYLDQGGGAWQPTHNRQYGPLFMFVALPFVALGKGDMFWLSRALYALQMIAFIGAFVLTWLTMRLYLEERRRKGPGLLTVPALTVLLLILWTNCSPAYYVMATKNVETWEMFLLSAALYLVVRGWSAISGIVIGAAAMIKMLPVAFLGMFMVRNWRALVAAVIAIFAILTAAQLTFGPAAGYRYATQVVTAAAGGAGYGNTQFALTWHENTSIKGMVSKVFGRLDSPLLPPPPFERRYHVYVPPDKAMLSNVLGLTLQLLGGVMFLWMMWRHRRPGQTPLRTEIWCWAVTAGFMLVLSPQSAFHYMILALPALSFVVVSVVEEWQPGRSVAPLLAAGVVFLIPNLAPRTVINAMLPLDTLRQWSGYTFLNQSEIYQYFGFPLLGMLLMIAYLWVVAPIESGR